LTFKELKKEVDKLPNQDPEFLVEWLMAQIVWLTNIIEGENVDEEET